MLLVRGGHVIIDTGTILKDAAICIEGETVKEFGSWSEMQQKYPAADVLGDGTSLVMPGLIDAHSHGRGLSPIQKGVLYDYLENAFLDWSAMVYLPNDLCSALSAVRHLRGGCTTIHHTGWNDEGPKALEQARQAINSYRETGIRLAYSPAVRDRNRFCIDEGDFLKTLPAELHDFVLPMTRYDARAIADGYLDLFETLHREEDTPMSRVLHGPSWAHGSTDEFFTRIRDSANAHGGTPIHIHTLQTPHQRAWSIKTFGCSLVEHLDRIGLLGPNTTLGHAVWLSEKDIDLIAERGASTTHHASCNLHVRNGISPVWYMMRKGINVALGIDDKSLNDDDDVLMELRMSSMLSRVPGFDLADMPPLTSGQILSMGTTNAARTLGFEQSHGTLQVGAAADLAVMETDSMLHDPWTSENLSIPDLLLWRGKGQDVRDVVVNGRIVIRGRKFQTIDVEGLYGEIRSYVKHHETKAATPERISALAKLRPYFHDWHRKMLDHLDISEPFYLVNGRH